MTSFERRARLLSTLQAQPGIRVPELARQLDVSEGTIRNDLRVLESSGKLTRVWGGGIPREGQSTDRAFKTRSHQNLAAKRAIAQVASAQVEDGDSILLDASTTVYQMAQFLQERHNLTVVTNGIEVGQELARSRSNTVILLGGILRPDGLAVTHPLQQHLLKDLHIKTAIISASGFSIEAGLTEVDLYEANFKRTMVASAERVIALIDSSKFGKVDLTACAWIDQVSHIYTDENLSAEWQARLSEAGVAFTLCSLAPASNPVNQSEGDLQR